MYINQATKIKIVSSVLTKNTFEENYNACATQNIINLFT